MELDTEITSVLEVEVGLIVFQSSRIFRIYCDVMMCWCDYLSAVAEA